MPVLKEIVPAEFHDREYLKPLLGLEQGPEAFKEVFKKLDGAESLLGKRPVLPTRDAKPEELEKFFEQWRPEKAEEYEVPIEKDAKVDPTFVKVVQKAFHDGRISRVQANGFLKTMNEYGVEQRKIAAAAKAKSDLEFDTLAKSALGEQNKVVMERVKKAIAEHAPAAYKGQIDKIDDKSLVLMAGVIDAIMKKYMSEDDLNAGGNGGGNGGDKTTKRAELKALVASKAYTDWQHPEHEATVAKVNQGYKELAIA